MKIGIILGCRREEKKGFLSFFKRSGIKEKELSAEYTGITVCSLCCKGRNMEKKLKKAEERLSLYGCSIIFTEDDLKSQVQLKAAKEAEKKMFFELALRMYKEYLKRLELKAYKMKLLIIDRECSAVSMAVIERLCFYSSKCDVLTENTEKAEKIRDCIFEQNGFFMDVGNVSQKGHDAVFDIDNMSFKIAGKVFINKLDLGLSELSEYNVSALETAGGLEQAGFKFRYDKTAGSTAYFKIV